ncbi:hypothetical protein MANES_01G039048v8 [Manihot esculenta]|uniref:Uncharacterized protein n=1 Tax=Manihot esculenta TaxID=3983 RepID=A0ACB7ID22_MANES|nr:hypothetical protein MANES_01G039048v8 [Manihot esculenta]
MKIINWLEIKSLCQPTSSYIISHVWSLLLLLLLRRSKESTMGIITKIDLTAAITNVVPNTRKAMEAYRNSSGPHKTRSFFFELHRIFQIELVVYLIFFI